MNTPAKCLRIELRQDLPIVVHGGITSWRIEMCYYGKNSGRARIYAQRIGHPHMITIMEGRASSVEHHIRNGMMAKSGTEDGDMLYRIFARLVRQGRAVRLQ